MNKIFSDKAWEQYNYWQITDKKILKRLNELIKDIDRNGNEGIGKPETLKYELAGYWSRRISETDRLIYKIDNENIYIASCKGHY